MTGKLLSFFIVMAVFNNAYGQYQVQGINGSADRREVIGWDGPQPDYSRALASTKNIWNTSPYNSIVHILPAYCTGEFISPKHILTNAHCGQECGMDGHANCEIHTSDGLVLSAREVFYGMKVLDAMGKFDSDKWNKNREKDWVILEVIGGYCRPEYRQFSDYPPSSTISDLWRAGFGSLRVLTSGDINAIRMAYDAYLRAGGTSGGNLAGGMNIDDHDPSYKTKYKVFTDAFTRITGKDFWRDYDWDVNTLKLIRNCQFTGADGSYKNIVRHSCDSWGGDSGSSIKNLSSKRIVGIEYAGWANITSYSKTDGTDVAILPYFAEYPNVQSAIKKAEQDCKKGVGTQPIETIHDDCELRCDNYVFGACNNTPDLEKKCRQATGKGLLYKGNQRICVDYDKSPICRGTIIPELGERKLGGECLSSDLPAHATAGHYIKSGRKKLECDTGVCSCAATACETGFYLAANAKGWSMGWCRSGRCPKGKHPNIINETKMTGCVDD